MGIEVLKYSLNTSFGLYIPSAKHLQGHWPDLNLQFPAWPSATYLNPLPQFSHLYYRHNFKGMLYKDTMSTCKYKHAVCIKGILDTNKWLSME